MKRLTVISLGGGVQSLVMALMASWAEPLTEREVRRRSRRSGDIQKGGGKDYGY